MSGVDPRHGPYGIGLHRPFLAPEAYKDSPNKVAEKQQSMTAAVREYLRREQVPEPIIDKMLERSSREVYWLSESEDAFELNSLAAWFEEMMIARCDYDPVYVRESQAREMRQIRQFSERSGSSKYVGDQASHDYLKWRQNYNACEYQVRRSAQDAMRK